MSISHSINLIELANLYGGHWGEHPDYPASDWAGEAASDETRLGYWEWVLNKIENSDDGLPEMGSEDTHADNGSYTDYPRD